MSDQLKVSVYVSVSGPGFDGDDAVELSGERSDVLHGARRAIERFGAELVNKLAVQLHAKRDTP